MTDQTEAIAIAEEEILDFVGAFRRELVRARIPDAIQEQHLSDEEFRDALYTNHGEVLVINAAAGVIDALVELRTACGLSAF